jgi:hypothetical protein
MPNDEVDVKVPRAIYEQLKQRIETSGGAFSGVDEYVVFLVKKALMENETGDIYTKDEELIKKRLRMLGYPIEDK